MAMKITKGKPLPPSKFLIIGEPFSGKTTLASKAPKPIFISTDGNAIKAGLDSLHVKSVDDLKEAMQLALKGKAYETIVIDTIEGIGDLFMAEVLEEHNTQGFRNSDGTPITSLQDVPYGKATGAFNARLQNFANILGTLPCNVVVLSYIKRRIDDVTSSIKLDSEFKNVRFLTRFMDAQVVTSYDGDKYRAQITNKRAVVAGEVEYGSIEPFLKAIGWDMPKKSTKIGKAK